MEQGWVRIFLRTESVTVPRLEISIELGAALYREQLQNQARVPWSTGSANTACPQGTPRNSMRGAVHEQSKQLVRPS